MNRTSRRLAPLRRRAARLLLLWTCLGLVLALPPAGGIMAAPLHGGDDPAAMDSPRESTGHCPMSGPTAEGDGGGANHRAPMGDSSSSPVCDGPGCLCCPLLGGSGHHAGPGALGSADGLRSESLLAYRIPAHRDIHLPPEGPPPQSLV